MVNDDNRGSSAGRGEARRGAGGSSGSGGGGPPRPRRRYRPRGRSSKLSATRRCSSPRRSSEVSDEPTGSGHPLQPPRLGQAARLRPCRHPDPGSWHRRQYRDLQRRRRRAAAAVAVPAPRARGDLLGLERRLGQGAQLQRSPPVHRQSVRVPAGRHLVRGPGPGSGRPRIVDRAGRPRAAQRRPRHPGLFQDPGPARPDRPHPGTGGRRGRRAPCHRAVLRSLAAALRGRPQRHRTVPGDERQAADRGRRDAPPLHLSAGLGDAVLPRVRRLPRRLGAAGADRG
jgi:hypothetical protein